MKHSTEILANSPFVLKGLHATVPPFAAGLIHIELNPDRDFFEPDGRTIGRAPVAAALIVAAELALNEAAPAGATFSITGVQFTHVAPAVNQTLVRANLSGLDWASELSQSIVAEAVNGPSTVTVATARLFVVVKPA